MTDQPISDEHEDVPRRRFEIDICEQCLRLEGEMCHNPGCVFIRSTMQEVGEYLNLLLIQPLIDGKRVVVDEGARIAALPAQAQTPEAGTALRDAFRAGYNAHPADDGAGWSFEDGCASDLEPSAWDAWAALRQAQAEET